MSKYVALSQIKVGRVHYSAGSEVELTDAQALSLAEHGAIGLLGEVAPDGEVSVDAAPEVLEAVAVPESKPKRSRKAKAEEAV